MRRTQLLVAALAFASQNPTASAQCERVQVLPEGVAELERFGSRVAVDAGRMAIATSGSDDVWILTLDERHGYVDQVVAAPGPATGGFGIGLALAGDLLVVGAPYEGGGAVYVFEDQGAGFVQLARLVSPTAGAGAQFGWSVAASAGYVVVGEPYGRNGARSTGAATVFERVGSSWIMMQRLVPETAIDSDELGTSVALDGERVAIGAPHLSWSLSTRPGAVYVYELLGPTWTETAKLIPAGAQIRDRVGSDVDLHGSTLLVGANEARNAFGELYVYELLGATWTETDRIGPGPVAYGNFGVAIELSDDETCVAAGTMAENGWAGTVRLYEPGPGGWALSRILSASDAEPQAFFGASLDLDGDELVVGAAESNRLGEDTGAAYVYSLSGATCASEFSGEEYMSLSSGGVQTFFLSAGAAHAGRTYVIGGTASGTSPGTEYLGARIPINFDAYTVLSTGVATWITNQGGVLDGKGQAAARLNVPAGLPLALAGTVLHHAAVILDAGAVVHVTNVARLVLEP